MIQNCLIFFDNYYQLVCYGVIIAVLALIFYHAIYMMVIFYEYKLCRFSEKKFDRIKSYGDWVVITGSTDGIGKIFAEKLAMRRFNLFLISRNPEKLQSQSQELKQRYHVSVRYFAADFTKTDIYEEIENQLTGIPIGFLINNVGMSYPCPDFIMADHLSNEDLVDILHCNCLSTVLMTKILLKVRMISHGGVIINLSSGSSFIDTPVLSMYASCKALINSFSKCIQAEVYAQELGDRVFIQNFTPFWIISKLSGMKKREFLVPKTEEFVDSCLRQLCRNHHSFGYVTHSYEHWFLNKFVPKFFRDRLVRNSMISLKKRGDLKRERLKGN